MVIHSLTTLVIPPANHHRGKSVETSRSALIILALAMASGCASDNHKAEYYQPPSSDNGAAYATIVGSGSRSPSAISGQVTFVSAVDGQPLRSAKQNTHTSTRVTPGLHSVGLEHRQGRWSGRTELQLDFKPEGEYIARSSVGKDAVGAFRGQAVFWIEDNRSKERVTDEITSSIESPEIEFRPPSPPVLPPMEILR